MKKLFSFLALFFVVQMSISYSQSVTEITKSLPQPYQNAYNDNYGKSVSVDGDYAVVGADKHLDERGCAYVLHNTGSAWETVASLKALKDSVKDYFGYSVSISGDVIIVGAYGDDDNGNSSGMVYVFEKPAGGWEDMTETAKLTANDEIANDNFGCSVSISGDVVVVGAYGNDANGGNSGALYVFEKPVGGWEDMTQTAKLTADDGVVGDYLGRSVSISGDTIVGGATGDDDNGTASGSAYVFEKPAGGWEDMTQTAKLMASDGAANDGFGTSVGIYDNVVIVGATGDDDNGTASGSAYVFEKPAGGWEDMTQTAKLTASDADLYDYLGSSVGIYGDVIIVGADGKEDRAGALYVFEKPDGGWVDKTQNAKLVASDATGQDNFANAIAISDNIIIVGAYGDDDEGTASGSSYIFKKVSTGWFNTTEKYKISPPAIYLSNPYDQYGVDVAIDGDYAVISSKSYKDQKGTAYVLYFDGSDWIIQARLIPSETGTGTNDYYTVAISNNTVVLGGSWNNGDKGSAYVFEKPSGGWVDMAETAILTASDGEPLVKFGNAVSISENVIAVGAFKDNEKGNSAGAVYVFEKTEDNWTNMTETAKLTASDATPDWAKLGSSVSVCGDLIVAGAPEDDEAGNSAGAVYLFEKPVSGWDDMTETLKITASDGDDNDEFGNAVDLSSTVLVVGAVKWGNSQGAVYVFEKPIDGWSNVINETAKLRASDGGYIDFACSVEISNNLIVVGAYADDSEGYATGSAYLYEKPKNGWGNMTETLKIIASDAAEVDYFGKAVAVSGDVILSGAHQDDDQMKNSGSAYFYKYCTSTFLATETDTIICENENISFKVNYVLDSLSVSYQWQKYSDSSWEDLTENSIFSGVTTDMLNITSANVNLDSALFRCKVTNYCGDVISDTAQLIIISLNVDLENGRLCEGSSLVLSPTLSSNHTTLSGTFSYEWSPSESLDYDNIENPTATPGVTTSYKLVLRDERFCSDSTIAEVFVQSSPVINICMVSVDTSENENLIVWEKPETQAIESFNIYKEGLSDDYQLIGNRLYSELSEFIDTSSAPNVHADKYKITVVDTCGNESELSPFHQTMNLSQAQGAQDDELVLIWNKYIDESGEFTPSSYKVYRGVDRNDMTLEATLSGTLSSYNYNVESVEEGEHFIVVVDMPTCTPTKASGGPYYQSTSNIEDEGLFNTLVGRVNTIDFNIYPNPVNKTAIISSNQTIKTIKIYSMTGELIKQYTNVNCQQFQFDRSGIAAGAYFVKINDYSYQKIIFE